MWLCVCVCVCTQAKAKQASELAGNRAKQASKCVNFKVFAAADVGDFLMNFVTFEHSCRKRTASEPF